MDCILACTNCDHKPKNKGKSGLNSISKEYPTLQRWDFLIINCFRMGRNPWTLNAWLSGIAWRCSIWVTEKEASIIKAWKKYLVTLLLSSIGSSLKNESGRSSTSSKVSTNSLFWIVDFFATAKIWYRSKPKSQKNEGTYLCPVMLTGMPIRLRAIILDRPYLS